jgi:short subunit dehydrogenase-like uncharacterized protein
MAAREFDVVVFGATSVTGRRVAAHLDDRASDAGLRWAAAARDLGKLERVLGDDGVAEPATIVADVGDPASLRAMAERASVVVNLVGPYTRYGEPVIAACIEAGCHYLDATGEIPFVRRTIDRFHAKARQAGLKVVQVCGYEALPPDLGVLLAADAVRERLGQSLAEVELEAAFTRWPPGALRLSDLMSGGTMQSMAMAAGDSDASRLTDPGALIEDPAAAEAVRARSPIRFRFRRGASGAWLVPMAPFAYINPAVIQRTAALVAAARGEDFAPFAYREGVVLTANDALRPLRSAAAGIVTGTQIAMATASRARPAIRSRASAAMGRIFPSSGFGPAAERLEPWRWRLSIFAQTTGAQRIEVEIDGEGHPGYLATSRMLGEAGMIVAEPGLTPREYGCLTPATAIGSAAIDRFAHAGLRFSLRD